MVADTQIVGQYGADADHDDHPSAQNAQKRVYLMPDFCQISIPLQNPGEDEAEWVRVNGSRTYTIHPLTVIGDDGRPKHHWVYGKIARLLIIWISTQVVRQKSWNNDRIIQLPDTLNELMDELGIHHRPTGSDYKRFRQQLEAITNFHMTVNDRAQGPLKGRGFMIADSWQIGWCKAEDPDNEKLAKGSYIRLTEETWKRMRHSMPLDAALVETFTATGKGQDLDIYAWLTQRIYALNHSKTYETPVITWEALSMQLGANYTRLDNFVARISKSLERIHMHWPFRYDVVRGKGIRLFRSPMTVTPVSGSPADTKPEKTGTVTKQDNTASTATTPAIPEDEPPAPLQNSRPRKTIGTEYIPHFIGSTRRKRKKTEQLRQ